MKKVMLFITSLCATIAAQSQVVNLTVTVNNVKSSKGTVRISVFNQANGFPEKTSLALKCISIKAETGTVQVKIDGLAASNYAIAAYHDEDNDGKFNTNFLGIPKETAGASNGAHGKMGPPKFADAVLMIDKNRTQISITLH